MLLYEDMKTQMANAVRGGMKTKVFLDLVHKGENIKLTFSIEVDEYHDCKINVLAKRP